MKRTVTTLAMLVLAEMGCRGGGVSSDGPPNDSQVVCDPLAPAPITLGTVVGVGQDSDGTLYVDAANGVFISANGSLVRQHVVGSGQSGANNFAFSFVAPGADPATARDLIVETDAEGVTMTLGPGGSGKQQLQGACDNRRDVDDRSRVDGGRDARGQHAERDLLRGRRGER